MSLDPDATLAQLIAGALAAQGVAYDHGGYSMEAAGRRVGAHLPTLIKRLLKEGIQLQADRAPPADLAALAEAVGRALGAPA